MSNFAIADPKRLPYGNPSFSAIRAENMIYVDKTALIAEIASQRAPIFFHGLDVLVNLFS